MDRIMTASPGATAFPATPALTSTTAPGKIFKSRSDLQRHYKSDWHRYNLKRREAGLPMLNETDFDSRLEASVALRKEREGREERTGLDHRKDKSGKNKKDKKKSNKQHRKGHKRKPAFAKREGRGNLANDHAEEREETEKAEPMLQAGDDDDNDASSMDEGQPEINPSQSLFDDHASPTPLHNLKYMQSKYSFYLPESEYCADLEGFLGYCNEKVRLGNLCLYCQKSFTSTEGVLKHMRDKRHCKIMYERGVDQEEFDVFYDFSEANREFSGQAATNDNVGDDAMEVVDEDDEGWEDVDYDDEGEWEDASMKEESTNNEEDDDDLYAAYQTEIASHGFDITPLGELVFPDGRTVGHRGLARYYKQRFAPDRMERAAVRHAREAAGDRLYEGRVVNLYQLNDGREENDNAEGGFSTALATMDRMAGSIPTGRNGKGILVSGEGKGGFTSLSLYRYRAAVKKQRREDARGQRLQHRSQMNMNKMNKKGNNIATGVVTALAPR